jgi:hypothetical protein
MVAAIFLVCSTFGTIIGLMVRTDHPRIEVLSVYPNAQSVSPLTPGRAGTLSTPTAKPIALPTLLSNFVFSTTDTHEQVLAYYRDVMERGYGMQLEGDKPTYTADGVTMLRYLRRAVYQNWTVGDMVVPSLVVMERITITIDSQTPGITRGTVHLDIVQVPY